MQTKITHTDIIRDIEHSKFCLVKEHYILSEKKKINILILLITYYHETGPSVVTSVKIEYHSWSLISFNY
jgi:hypothetical protein